MSSTEYDDELAIFTYSPMDEAQAEALCDIVRNSGKFREVLKMKAGCTIVSHCGPNCAAFIALKK